MLGGDRLLLGLLDEALRAERLAGTQRDHRLQLRQGEPVGVLLRLGDHHVDGQERARRRGSSSLGWNPDRYSSSASAVPCPEKWCANT